jgi:hypothetical protein
VRCVGDGDEFSGSMPSESVLNGSEPIDDVSWSRELSKVTGQVSFVAYISYTGGECGCERSIPCHAMPPHYLKSNIFAVVFRFRVNDQAHYEHLRISTVSQDKVN